MKTSVKLALATVLALSTTQVSAQGRDAYKCINFDSPKIEEYLDPKTKKVNIGRFINAQKEWAKTFNRNVPAYVAAMKYMNSRASGKLTVADAKRLGCDLNPWAFKEKNGL